MINSIIANKTDDDLIGCIEVTEDHLVHGSYPKPDEVQYLKALYAEAKKRNPAYVSPYEHRHCFFV